MDRYQFEDLISDYLEGALSQDKRKEFELYLEDHADLRSQVESMRNMLDSLHGLSVIKSSPEFMSRLMDRIETEKSRKSFGIPFSTAVPRTLFGFKPAYAGLMGAVVVAIVAIAFQFMPGNQGYTPVTNSYTSQETEQNTPEIIPESDTDLARGETVADDSTEVPKSLPDREFQENLILVKDQK